MAATDRRAGIAKIEVAKRVADKLKAEGRHIDAESVATLCRAHRTLINTASELWHDNARLRGIEQGGRHGGSRHG